MPSRWVRIPRVATVLLLFGAINVSFATTNASAEPAAAHTELFEFHSGFWINLHHFLYLAALTQRSANGRRTPTMSEADIAVLTSLSTQEQQRWSKAVTYYAGAMVQHDLLFDRDMEAIKNALEDAESSPDLAGVQIPGELRAVLVSVAPVYREHLWSRHDAQNRKWMDAVRPLVAAYGAGLRDSLVKVYDEPWPPQPVRVDVAVYGGESGAYTTIEPTRVSISSTDPANQGDASLEVLFHETSHGMVGHLRDAVRAAEARLNPKGTQPPFRSGTMWHAVVFYTTGQLVAEKIRGYVPYAQANGLWSLAWPPPERELIARDWKPHMDGTVSLEDAIYNLARDWKGNARQQPVGGPEPQ